MRCFHTSISTLFCGRHVPVRVTRCLKRVASSGSARVLASPEARRSLQGSSITPGWMLLGRRRFPVWCSSGNEQKRRQQQQQRREEHLASFFSFSGVFGGTVGGSSGGEVLLWERVAALLFGPGLGLAMWGDARPLGRSHAAYDLKVDFASRESLRDPRLRPKAHTPWFLGASCQRAKDLLRGWGGRGWCLCGGSITESSARKWDPEHVSLRPVASQQPQTTTTGNPQKAATMTARVRIRRVWRVGCVSSQS